jgi:hypothetical protein
MVANEWAPIAKRIFQSAPAEERKLGAHLLLVGISPSEYYRGSKFPRVYVIRFAFPDFTPGFFRKSFTICSIGSGSGVMHYKRALKPLFDIRSAPLQVEVAGFGWCAKMLAHSMSSVIQNHPKKGISHHLNIFAFLRGEIIVTNNDETIYLPGGAEPIIIKMPRIATSYNEFLDMADRCNVNASCASC